MIILDGDNLRAEGSLPGERYVVLLWDYTVHYVTHKDLYDSIGHIDFHDRILWHGIEEDWMKYKRAVGIID